MAGLTRDEGGSTKRCSACNEEKPDDERNFRPRPGRTRSTAQCRKCEAAAEKRRDDERAGRLAAHVEEPDPERLESCKPWGSSFERQAVEALKEHGSLVAAAEALRISSRRLRSMFGELERRAASRGWAPAEGMRQPVPEGFTVKGVSTLYGKDGEVKGQWVKTQADRESRFEALAAACEKLADPLRALADPVPAPALEDKDLMCVYPMGDPHLGMHAWGEEAGDDFDLRIAQRNLYAAVDHLVSLAPPAHHALILNLGDFFHADSNAGTTTRGTRVDVDTRHGKVYEAGVRMVVRIVDRALEKHQRVTLRNNIGNHDENASVMLGICLRAYYSREPRVTVDTSPSPFTRYRHGRCLVATTHGNEVKHAELGEVMANDWPEDWGETEFRYWYIGHVHHEKVLERRGVVIESFRTLAAKDSWHNRAGYRSGRDMRLDVLHAQHGLVNRHVVGIQRVVASAA